MLAHCRKYGNFRQVLKNRNFIKVYWVILNCVEEKIILPSKIKTMNGLLYFLPFF